MTRPTREYTTTVVQTNTLKHCNDIHSFISRHLQSLLPFTGCRLSLDDRGEFFFVWRTPGCSNTQKFDGFWHSSSHAGGRTRDERCRRRRRTTATIVIRTATRTATAMKRAIDINYNFTFGRFYCARASLSRASFLSIDSMKNSPALYELLTSGPEAT